jgi:hypothetical protein
VISHRKNPSLLDAEEPEKSPSKIPNLNLNLSEDMDELALMVSFQ